MRKLILSTDKTSNGSWVDKSMTMKKGNHSNLLMFAADGKLTEEALTACHMTGVEPGSLMQKLEKLLLIVL